MSFYGAKMALARHRSNESIIWD